MSKFRHSLLDVISTQRQLSTRSRIAPWKKAISATTVVAFLFVAAACAPVAEEAEAPEGPVSLRMSTWGNDSRLALTQQAIDAYMVDNPLVTVTIENSEFGSYWDKLATTTAANDAPDIIQMDESYIAAYGTREALLDLDEVTDVLDLSGLDATVLDTGVVDGVLVGAPVGVANYAIGVNPQILEAAGVEMPDDTTWTWDDLADIAAEVTAKLGADGVYGLSQFGTSPAELGFWARQRGEEIWADDSQTPISAETVSSYLDFAAELIEMGATPPASSQVENVTGAQDASSFATNKAAFHPLFNTQISSFGATSGTELELLRLPAQESGESAGLVNKASMYWSISARTEHSEAAAKLIDYLLNDPDATKLLSTERGIPANPAVQDAIAAQLAPQARVALEYAQSLADDLVSPPRVTPPDGSGFTGEFSAVSTEALFGQTSSADAADRTLSIIDRMK
jgi:multiple sugar transport system substrate-binding protein